MHEVEIVINETKLQKFAGADGIPVEGYTFGDEELTLKIHQMITKS